MSSSTRPLMCHVVAGYPTAEACLRLLQGMQRAGVAAIEVQIPFSDPIADGATIMEANDVALAGGMTTAGSFVLIEQARSAGVDTDLYIMSYFQKVRHFGLAEFCEQAAQCAVKGLIIPDLPHDSPEFLNLSQLAAKHQLQLVPVLSPGMLPERLKAVLAGNPQTLYLTSTQGITGNRYAPAKQLRQLVTAIQNQSPATIMIGFGITSIADVTEVLSIGDIAVVGSAVIKQLQNANVDKTLNYIKTLLRGNS
jgi:tryptophan synthase alpha subunit